MKGNIMNNEKELTRKERFGKWLDRNADDIAVVTVPLITIVGTIGLFAWAVKADQKAIKDYNEQVMELNKAREETVQQALDRGAQVLPAAQGGYWINENGNTTLI